MAEYPTTRRRYKNRFFLLVFILSIGLGIFFLVKSCTSDISPVSANILLEKGGQKYLFSALPTSVVQQSLDNGDLPAVFDNLLVYRDGDAYYLSPSTIQNVAGIAAGEYILHPHRTSTASGYVSAGMKNSYSMQTSYRSTSELGRQDIVSKVMLTNAKGKHLNITWTQNAKEYEFYDMKNCEVHSFWTETHPAPGEVVISSKDYLVVSVDVLAHFFGRTIRFDPEANLLIVRQ